MTLRDWMKSKLKKASPFLCDYWDVVHISTEGILTTPNRHGFVFEAKGIDHSFFSDEQTTHYHNLWRSLLQLQPSEELQIIYRKRVGFVKWVEDQLLQSFLADSPYGRRIILDRLAEQVKQMSYKEPLLLSSKIIVTFWTSNLIEKLDELKNKQTLIQSQLMSFGFEVNPLDKNSLFREINISAQDLNSTELQEPEWPSLAIKPDELSIRGDIFRSLELKKLPENATEFGMIQALTQLPFPIDICVRFKGRDIRPVVNRLERKRNLLDAKRKSSHSPQPQLDSQLEQIDRVLRNLADKSESLFKMSLVVGLRFPKDLDSFQRKALSFIMRSGAEMDFCEFEECTLNTFDTYLDCLPGFSGKNILQHTILASNGIHFLPFFCNAAGDREAIVSFHTRNGQLFGLNPVNAQSANYNWLVSGTSGSGKSFFVNSLLAQSLSLNPEIFIVDIGGSYNKLTKFLGGRVMSLEPGQGFSLSPFFLAKNDDPNEEKLRRQHIFQIFLEMTRNEGQLPEIEIRHLLYQTLERIFIQQNLPQKPISYLVEELKSEINPVAKKLIMLLQPWSGDSYYAQFLDNNHTETTMNRDSVLTFDLKGLTDFTDLSRVIQLIVCARLWARIRQKNKQSFSWIVLDEVAFSLLKSNAPFVDELVSTLRKHYAGAIIIVQDLEKITSNLAGSSILQNTHNKAILQQRGHAENYTEALSLSPLDRWAIESLQREKGLYADIFLIRDQERILLRYRPSPLEYWLSTTSPEDGHVLGTWMGQKEGPFAKKIIDFVKFKEGAAGL